MLELEKKKISYSMSSTSKQQTLIKLFKSSYSVTNRLEQVIEKSQITVYICIDCAYVIIYLKLIVLRIFSATIDMTYKRPNMAYKKKGVTVLYESIFQHSIKIYFIPKSYIFYR